MIELIGHFHPVIVHLPIGIFVVALWLRWLSRKEKYSSLKQAVPLILLSGAITAIVACITGYMLSITDDYDRSMVNWHMWMAIGVVLVSLILYTKHINPRVEVSEKLLSVGLLALIIATGHFGGSLTHGSDYLTKPLTKILSRDTVVNTVIRPLANVQEAIAYQDVIQPILKTKCYSCHNENKQKGKLRMDDIHLLLKGGKHGSIIDMDIADSSEMLQRLLLPVDNEHHMPPKEKPQPSEEQIALIRWWLQNKADFQKKVKDLNQPEKIKPVLLALQQPVTIKKTVADLPPEPVEKADEKIIQQLAAKGFVFLPVSLNSNYLTVNLSNISSATKGDFGLLTKLSKQIVSVRINSATVNDELVRTLSKLTNVRKLHLSNANITDSALLNFVTLQDLQQLNLVGTQVTANGLLSLQKLKNLSTLYLFQTGVTQGDYKKLQTAFPKTKIDFGNYTVPLLATDTMQVKASALN